MEIMKGDLFYVKFIIATFIVCFTYIYFSVTRENLLTIVTWPENVLAGASKPTIPTSPKKKICDVFIHNGQRLCGPAFFVPGFGKCGTNSLFKYLLAHPHVKRTKRSEVSFDFSADYTPLQFILDNNPNVTEDDPYIWIVKHPAALDEQRHWKPSLPLNVRRAFPSAIMGFTVCDPTNYLFRWFRHHTTQALYHKVPGQKLDFKSREDKERARASAQELAEFLQNFGVRDLRHYFDLFWEIDLNCTHSDFAKMVIENVYEKFWYGDRYALLDQCERWRDKINFGKMADALNVGYSVNESFVVFAMEEWNRKGEEYMKQLMKLLRLDVNLYNWDQTHNFPKHFSSDVKGFGLDQVDSPMSSVFLDEANRQCHITERIAGTKMPWEVCMRKATQ